MCGFFPASSRQWKPTPDALARDYATITDARANGELVVLMWIVPRMVQPTATGAAAATAMAQKYVMLVVVRGRLDKATGSMSFDDIDSLDAKDQSGKALTAVSRNDLPPNSTAMVAALEAVFRQSMGAMGKGMKMFIFEGANIDSCKKGQLSVPFGSETYTWDTPFPGCDQKS
ncbi:MAG: hypothetical protein JOY90_14715 [Bradyrhizobium sp.]|uniref:hypothetical protein n=1 Tax=Bradyrhizobium sp. TaxID=376 RepID=UPI001D6DB4DF|nr:hypothetical protein [Bradyrhizobium sp.]MBV9561681.1 hypothetical protein [Bradyrhizobium sp.]